MNYKILTCLLLTLVICACVFGATDPELTAETLTDSAGNSADAESKVTFADLPTASYLATNDTYSDTGVEWWYNFVNFFIEDIVFPEGFPTKTIAKYLDGSLITELTSKYNGLVVFGEFGGFVVFLLTGFIFIFVFPLIGCCFCCCRCCCSNCGGDMMQKKEDAENNCKRRTYVVILLILIMTTCLGMVCMYMTNSNISLAVTKFNSSFNNNLDDMGTFVDNMNSQVKQIGKTNFNFTQDVINRDLDSIGYIIGIPVRTTITTHSRVEIAMASVLSLGEKITDIANAMTALNTQVDECKTAASSFSSEMTSLTDYISQINTECQANVVACASTPLPNTASYNIKLDTSSFPDLSSQVNKTASLSNTNFTELTTTAQKELTDIPWRVQNETKSTVKSIRSTVSDFSSKTDSFVELVEGLQTTVKESLVNQAKGMVDMDTYIQYDQFRNYGGLALSGLILLVVVTMLLATLCAVAGHRNVKPTERGCCSTCGGRCYMVSVCLVFLISSFLMMLTVAMFMLGAPLRRFVCNPLTSTPYATQFSNILDTTLYEVMNGNSTGGSLLGNMLLKNSSADLTLSGLLKSCEANKGSFEALKFDSQMNMSSLTNFKSTMDIDSQINDINIDLSSVKILTDDLVNNLDDLQAAVDIDFDSFYNQINGGAMNGDIDTLISLLDTLSSLTAISPYHTQYGIAKTWAETIKTQQLATLETEMAETKYSVENMQNTTLGVDDLVSTVKNNLNTTEQYIRNNASSVIANEAKVYAQRLMNVVEYFINDTVYALNNELGTCRPLYNFYNSLLRITLCQHLVDSLNGFWFAIGWCVFFFLPSIIFATKLAKHYKRMSRLDEPDSPEKEPLPEDDDEEEEEEEDDGLKVLENQNSFYKRFLLKKGFQDPLSRMARIGNSKIWHSDSPPPYSEKPSTSKSRSTMLEMEEKGAPW